MSGMSLIEETSSNCNANLNYYNGTSCIQRLQDHIGVDSCKDLQFLKGSELEEVMEGLEFSLKEKLEARRAIGQMEVVEPQKAGKDAPRVSFTAMLEEQRVDSHQKSTTSVRIPSGVEWDGRMDTLQRGVTRWTTQVAAIFSTENWNGRQRLSFLFRAASPDISDEIRR